MKNILLKRVVIAAFSVMLLLSGCSSGEKASITNEYKKVSLEKVPELFQNPQDIKVKVIRKIGGDDHTEQFLAGAKEEGEALGITVDVFSAEGDNERFHREIKKGLDEDYDGFIISHGEDPETVEDVKMLIAKGKKVVTFDSHMDIATLKGVTVTSQDDEALATLALEQLIDDYDGNAKIAYLWVDGFPPMIRRNVIYQETLAKNPGIQEVGRFGIAAPDTSEQTQKAVAEMLSKYPKGELDAIFATWDAFAIGAVRAIKEAGRDDVKIYGIDVSNGDLELMKENGNQWKYTAAVDPKLIGAINMRLVVKKLAGEETPQQYNLEAYLIDQEEIQVSKEPVTMANLGEVLPGWGLSNELEEDWMRTLKEYKQNSK